MDYWGLFPETYRNPYPDPPPLPKPGPDSPFPFLTAWRFESGYPPGTRFGHVRVAWFFDDLAERRRRYMLFCDCGHLFERPTGMKLWKGRLLSCGCVPISQLRRAPVLRLWDGTPTVRVLNDKYVRLGRIPKWSPIGEGQRLAARSWFRRLVASSGWSEESISSAHIAFVGALVSALLDEGFVRIPGLGRFWVLRRDNGGISVKFSPETSLRGALNGRAPDARTTTRGKSGLATPNEIALREA